MTVFEARRVAVPIGREEEIGRILRCLDVRSGPQGLLALGETGTGRSLLLRFAEETAVARGSRVLSARGWGGEEPAPFASLHRLLLPVLDVPDLFPKDRWPVPRTAFEPGAGAGPQERRALCAVTLALLTRIARTNPLLVAVDDAQDWDDASLDVLFSVRRQLTDQAVTMLFTAHGEGPLSRVPADLPVLRLGPLPPGAAARLLDAQPDAPRGGSALTCYGRRRAIRWRSSTCIGHHALVPGRPRLYRCSRRAWMVSRRTRSARCSTPRSRCGRRTSAS